MDLKFQSCALSADLSPWPIPSFIYKYTQSMEQAEEMFFLLGSSHSNEED